MKQKITVRTTPEEVAKYKAIKTIYTALQNKVNETSDRLKEVYRLEGRPLVGGLEMLSPKSAAVRKVDAELCEAMEVERKFRIKIGAKRFQRMHRLELAGLI